MVATLPTDPSAWELEPPATPLRPIPLPILLFSFLFVLILILVLAAAVSLCTAFVLKRADAQLMEFAARTGLHMGQWLCLPMILGGLYLIVTSKGRRARVEPIAGNASVS